MKNFEPCSLEEATHVAMGGTTYKIGDYEVRGFLNSTKSERVGINILLDGYDERTIRQDLFPILGIVPLKEIKPEPIEFEATFAMYDGNWYPLHSFADRLSYLNCKKATFKCVEILEEEK